MKTITIGLSRHIGFNIISLGIRLFQKTTYSHAYIKIHIPEIDRTAVFQATGIGVNFTSLEVFNSKDIKINEWDVTVSDEIFNNILCFCFDEVGKPYSIKMIIGIIFYTLFSWKLFKSDKLNSFICSELVGYVLKLIGVIHQDQCLDYFTPKDVETTMNKQIGH